MAEEFEPSPRASKRRRTTETQANSSPDVRKENGASEKSSVVRTSGNKRKRLSNGLTKAQVGQDQENMHDPEHNNDMDMAEEIDHSMSEKPQAESPSQQRRIRDTTPPQAPDESEDKEGDAISTQPRSSGRERRKPRRFLISPEKPKTKKKITEEPKTAEPKSVSVKKRPTAQATPKGILTPSRKEKRTGPRKSVIFDESEKGIEEQFGFKDIGNVSTKKTSTSKIAKAGVAVPEDDTPSTPSKKSRKQVVPPVQTTTQVEVEPELDFDEILSQDVDEMYNDPIVAEPTNSEFSGFNIEDDTALLAIKSTVLSRLVSRSTISVPAHLQTQYSTLNTLLQATVTSGESNSLLLLGARGTGKSKLLETAISDLKAKHSDDFHTVRLNGFFQTDDKLALREVWRQLGREMQVDETEDLGGSYADTMSSLLSLLSHPDEFIDPTANGTDAMDIEGGATRTSKSIIFILDEFDLFTTHPRQTLLYNLFDIAQSKKAPIAVVGCSTRMDIVDCLEKRVKSRFSHRWLHIPSAKSLDAFEEIVRNALTIEASGVAVMRVSKEHAERVQSWNAYIQSIFLPSLQIQALIKRTFYTTKSIPNLFVSLYILIATIQLPISGADTTQNNINTRLVGTADPPNMLSLLSSLPTLHLSLLIAASRLDTIHNLTTLNFNLVYAHYVELISRSKLQVTASGARAVGASLRQWTRDTAISAWEDLGAYGCVVPVSGVAVGAGGKESGAGGGDSIGGEGASVRMWRVDVTLEDLSWSVKEKWTEIGGARDVLSKWCREI